MSNLTKSELIKTLKTNALKDAETIVHIKINNFRDEETRGFIFNTYEINEPSKTWYSLSEKAFMGRSMNVEKITKNYIYLYTFNMLSQKQNSKIKLTDLTIIN